MIVQMYSTAKEKAEQSVYPVHFCYLRLRNITKYSLASKNYLEEYRY